MKANDYIFYRDSIRVTVSLLINMIDNRKGGYKGQLIKNCICDNRSRRMSLFFHVIRNLLK